MKVLEMFIFSSPLMCIYVLNKFLSSERLYVRLPFFPLFFLSSNSGETVSLYHFIFLPPSLSPTNLGLEFFYLLIVLLISLLVCYCSYYVSICGLIENSKDLFMRDIR